MRALASTLLHHAYLSVQLLLLLGQVVHLLADALILKALLGDGRGVGVLGAEIWEGGEERPRLHVTRSLLLYLVVRYLPLHRNRSPSSS